MHLLQSPQWGQFKSGFGWSAEIIRTDTVDIPVQILYRRLATGFQIAYIPKGPDIAWDDQELVRSILLELKAIAARPSVLFLKIEPDVADNPNLTRQFIQAGFRPGKPVQPPNSIIIDLCGSEDEVLARMKQKTRYNIRLAARKGVAVRQGAADDVPIFYELNQVTEGRNDFAIHSLAYYQSAFEHFAPERCALLLAEFQGQPLAGVMIFAWQKRAYYLYGASNNRHRNLMPTYLLQWQAIRWARSNGCQTYDMWGIPDAPEETLEAEFTHRSDGLWGVYRHKRGYGGQVIRSIGAFDHVASGQIHKQVLYAALAKYLERRST
jgi:lipid II:glycine glycyltransferase (peptidoglycan interpeptide bridge formation enzyme)